MNQKLYPYISPAGYRALNPVAKIPHVAAYYADIEHVRELGVNAGLRVQEFLANVGLGKGYAWCAAFVYSVALEAGVPASRLPKARKAAGVAEWVKWAEQEGILCWDELFPPKRGCLVGWLNGDGTGHIGIVVHRATELRNLQSVTVSTIEGNTNAKGGREGDGVYRKLRPWPNDGCHRLFWIDLTKLNLS